MTLANGRGLVALALLVTLGAAAVHALLALAAHPFTIAAFQQR